MNEEAKLANDPKKAEQLERLGMAVGSRSSGISHSALGDMQIIQQEGEGSRFAPSSQPSSAFERRADLFDDFDAGFASKSLTSGAARSKSDWVVVDSDKFIDDTVVTSSSGNEANNGRHSTQSTSSGSSRNEVKYSAPSSASYGDSSDATKRFANAKSISSAQFFGNDRSEVKTEHCGQPEVVVNYSCLFVICS